MLRLSGEVRLAQNRAAHSQKAVTASYGGGSMIAVQVRTERPVAAEVDCSMTIDRDDGAERQARVDLMINTFRETQSRRGGKPNESVVESTLDANTKGPLTKPAVPR